MNRLRITFKCYCTGKGGRKGLPWARTTIYLRVLYKIYITKYRWVYTVSKTDDSGMFCLVLMGSGPHFYSEGCDLPQTNSESFQRVQGLTEWFTS